MNRFVKAVEQAKKAILEAFEFTALVDETIDKYDLVEVVRCKDCRWGHLCVFGQHLGLDGFCSKGERKEKSDG